MKQILLTISLLSCTVFVQSQTTPHLLSPTSLSSEWTVTKITGNNAVERPYEMIYGPDNRLWIAERRDDVTGITGGKRIVRIDTTGANRTTMINFGNKVFTNQGQDGVLGIVAHPALYVDPATTTNNYVFVSYTYSSTGLESDRKTRIVRLIYNNVTGTLTEDTSLNPNGTILEGLPASNDHNSGKLAIGPDLKLYYTIGDQGNNQFARSCNPILARVLPTFPDDFNNYPGKLLRMNLDGTVPSDNPTLGGVKSRVFNYGHRNMQGLQISSAGIIYSSEHGDRVDDELNVMEAGKDYGWPNIAGSYTNDGSKWYDFTNNSITTACGGPLTVAQATQTELQAFPSGPPANFVPPISNMGSGSATFPSGGNATWPTLAPGGLALYENTDKKIKDWGNFVLIPGLKFNTIQLGRLSSDGLSILDSLPDRSLFAWHTVSSGERFRQVVVARNGVSFYIVTDNNSATNPGSITKILYHGPLEPTLSTDENALTNVSLKLYPNPTATSFSLSFPAQNAQNTKVSIVDLMGRIVMPAKTVQANQPVDVSRLSNGVYLVNITDSNNKSVLKKLVVAK